MRALMPSKSASARGVLVSDALRRLPVSLQFVLAGQEQVFLFEPPQQRVQKDGGHSPGYRRLRIGVFKDIPGRRDELAKIGSA
jgi:hypothetical protein